MFFPIFPDTIEEKEERYYIISVPKIFIINLSNKGLLHFYFENANNNIYKAYSNETVNLTNINKIIFEKASKIDKMYEKYGNYGIIIVSPFNKPIKIFIANKILTQYSKEYSKDSSKEYIFPPGQKTIIYLTLNATNEIEQNLEYIFKMMMMKKNMMKKKCFIIL